MIHHPLDSTFDYCNLSITRHVQATTWSRPAPLAKPLPEPAGTASPAPPPAAPEAPKGPSWGLFGLSVDEIRGTLPRDLVAAQAEMFLANGDMNSNLYTSSRAMHSAIIGLLQVCPFQTHALAAPRTHGLAWCRPRRGVLCSLPGLQVHAMQADWRRLVLWHVCQSFTDLSWLSSSWDRTDMSAGCECAGQDMLLAASTRMCKGPGQAVQHEGILTEW